MRQDDEARDGATGREQEASPSLRSAVRSDLAQSTIGGRIALVGVCIWLAYEWGPGNETFTPWILARVLSASNGWTAIATTAAVGFTFTTLQQLASGLTALAGFAVFRRTALASWRLLQRRGAPPAMSWESLGWMRRAVLVFTLGTTAIALIQTMTTGTTGVRRHWRVVSSSAALCGAVVAVLGGVVAALVVLAERVPALAGPVHNVVRVLGNPLLWLTIAAGMLLLPLATRRGRPR